MTTSSLRLSPAMKRELVAAHADKTNFLFTGKNSTRDALMDRKLVHHSPLRERILDRKGRQVATHGYVLTEAGIRAAAELTIPELDYAEYHLDVLEADGDVRRHVSFERWEALELITNQTVTDVAKDDRGVITFNSMTHGGPRLHVLTPRRPGLAWACKTTKPAAEEQAPGVEVEDGEYRMYVGVLREDARDMGISQAANVRESVRQNHEQGRGAERLEDGTIRAGYSWFVKVPAAVEELDAEEPKRPERYTVTETYKDTRTCVWTVRVGAEVVMTVESPQQYGLWDTTKLRTALAGYAGVIEDQIRPVRQRGEAAVAPKLWEVDYPSQEEGSQLRLTME